MNGCQARDPRTPVGMMETRTFPAVSTPAMAMERLGSAITELGSDPPGFGSGILRLEVIIINSLAIICVDSFFGWIPHWCVMILWGLSVIILTNGNVPCGWL